MKSVAIFLSLVFLTGFQSAVLIEEPPSIPESNQSLLEQMQEQFKKVSTRVTNSVNNGLGAIKESASNIIAFTADAAKKSNLGRLSKMKVVNAAKDMHGYSSAMYNQVIESVKEQYKKAVSGVEEMMNHPAMVGLNDKVIQPLNNKCQKFLTWVGEQNAVGIVNMMYKKLDFKGSHGDPQLPESMGARHSKLG